jgi:hypothetical protein
MKRSCVDSITGSERSCGPAVVAEVWSKKVVGLPEQVNPAATRYQLFGSSKVATVLIVPAGRSCYRCCRILTYPLTREQVDPDIYGSYQIWTGEGGTWELASERGSRAWSAIMV